MRKQHVLIGIFLLLVAYFYFSWDIYYISKWRMYVKIENANDTTKVFFSESRWHLGDNYIKYKPQSAEMSNLILHPIGDTLYTIERFMKIAEIHSIEYKIKPVRFIRDRSAMRDYWTDSTFIKENTHEWISINHRHGIYKSWR